jgi:hypothetical protein
MHRSLLSDLFLLKRKKYLCFRASHYANRKLSRLAKRPQNFRLFEYIEYVREYGSDPMIARAMNGKTVYGRYVDRSDNLTRIQPFIYETSSDDRCVVAICVERASQRRNWDYTGLYRRYVRVFFRPVKLPSYGKRASAKAMRSRSCCTLPEIGEKRESVHAIGSLRRCL